MAPSQVSDEAKRAELAKVLNLTPEEVAAGAASTASSSAKHEEEESFF